MALPAGGLLLMGLRWVLKTQGGITWQQFAGSSLFAGSMLFACVWWIAVLKPRRDQSDALAARRARFFGK